MGFMNWVTGALSTMSAVSQMRQMATMTQQMSHGGYPNGATPPFVDTSASSFQAGASNVANISNLSAEQKKDLQFIQSANQQLATNAQKVGVRASIAAPTTVASEYVNGSDEHKAMMMATADMIKAKPPSVNAADGVDQSDRTAVITAAFTNKANAILNLMPSLNDKDQTAVYNQALISLHLKAGVPPSYAISAASKA
jgi:hypothetical protein